MKLKLFIGLLLVLLSFSSFAQETIRTGKIYKGGDYIDIPWHGIKLTIPPKWKGYATEGTEMLTLSNDTANVTLRGFPVEDNLQIIKAELVSGMELTPGIEIKSAGEVKTTATSLKSELKISSNSQNNGYLQIECGESGQCVGLLINTNARNHASFESTLQTFFDNMEIGEPTAPSANSSYVWSEELNDKHIFHYESSLKGTLDNEFWLCPDGTFTARIKRKGTFKNYSGRTLRGKQKGTYKIEGKGEEGRIILTFSHSPNTQVILEGKQQNGEIYFNDVKYFLAYHGNCK
ncbi:hypothetical protein [Roseivirga pacifica]|uniref:hypothetical protein n=1 Tax=Roseivirga pacifica TaxID=1267423 RepID=UPI00227B288D|nr:hypothetical protein [Roseivirga pacifica]